MQLCTYAIRWYTYVIWSNGIRIIDWSWDGVAQSQTTLDNTRQPLPGLPRLMFVLQCFLCSRSHLE